VVEHGEGVVHPEEVVHPPPPKKDQAAAWIADRCATVEFAALNLVVVAVWGLVGIESFPFPFLTFVLSVEAILLTIFVLVQQRLETEMNKRESDADLKNDAIGADEAQKTHEALARIERLLTHGSPPSGAP
jgi:uncharacterized membrane protein